MHSERQILVIVGIVYLIGGLILPENALADARYEVSLAWDQSPEEDLLGYRLYHGNAQGMYTDSVDVGNQTSTTIQDLTGGITYFFAVTAYNKRGLESLPSAEVSVTLWNLGLTAQPDEAGQVLGGGTYTEGDEVEISAQANEGWRFLRWEKLPAPATSETEVLDPTSPILSLTIDRQLDPKAVFVRVWELDVQSADPRKGRVTGGGTYDDGDEPSISAMANPGFAFSGWEGDVSDNESASITVIADRNQTLRATFRDVEKPTIIGKLEDITQSSNRGADFAVVIWNEPTADDNLAINTFSSSHKPGDNFPIGRTTVSYVASDTAGNIATESFVVNIIDTEPPTLKDLPSDITVSTNHCHLRCK